MSIEAYPSPNGVLTSLIWRKTAAGGETSLSGYDNASQALSYTPGQEQVYLNGILLVRGSDYTATNGTSITSLTALAVDDFVQINCYNNFSVASVPAASLTGEVTNSQITSLATTKLTGTITNAQLAGSISNDKLTNSSITINGSAVALGGSVSLAGDIESVTAGTGISGGGSSGAVTITNSMATAIDAKGDLIIGTGADTFSKLGVGANGTVLTAASGEATGLSWAAPAGGGKVLQVVSAIAQTNVSIASTSYNDTGLTATITPTLSTSKILVMITQGYYVGNSPDSGRFYMAMKIDRQIASGSFSTVYRPVDTTQNNMIDIGLNTSQVRMLVHMSYLDSPSTTSACTYKTVANTNSTASNQSINFQLGGTEGQRGQSSIILMEIGA